MHKYQRFSVDSSGARFKFWGGEGWQGRRTSLVPPSLPPPLIFKRKFKIFVTLSLLKIRFKISVTPSPLSEKGQSQNYGASINSNHLLTLNGLLSLKFLLHMATSFIKENRITAYKLYMEYKTTTKVKQSTLCWKLKLIMTHNFTE